MISRILLGVTCVFAVCGNWAAQGATALNLGATYAGAISVPGQTNAFRFTGSPGQRLFLDSLDSDTLNLYATLISPGGVVLYQRNDDYDGVPWTLTEPGTYTLAFAANLNTSTTGNYSFRLLDLAAAPDLVLAGTLSDQLTPPLACNIYKFNATHGQRFSLQWLNYSTNQFQWLLLSPANATIAQGPYYQNLGPITLPIDGAYSLLIQGLSPGTAPLTFQLLASLTTDPTVASSGFGTPHAGNISANVTNSFTYTGSAGLPVYFDSLDASGQSLVVDLMDPTGTAVFSIAEINDAGPYVLPRSGTYTLNVRGPNGASGNFNFRLLDLSTSPTMPLNSVLNNSITVGYQTDVYQFNGAAGQRLYYDSQTGVFLNVHVQLLAPDGQLILNGASISDAGPFTLQQTGTHYVFLQNAGNGSGSYQFALFDAASQPALPLNADFTGTLAPYASGLYQLAGAAGQKLYFNGKGTSAGGASWTLYDSRNGGITGVNLAGDFEVTLPYTGGYLLLLSASSSSVKYTNQVSSITYLTNALTLGIAVSNNIVNPGDQLVYTFSGTAGQRIYYDALNGSYLSIGATLLAPSGLQIFSVNASSDFGPISLPESGTYQLIFDANSHLTGPIAFSLLDIAAQPALPLNSDLVGSLAPQVSLLYTIAATNGELLYFNSKSVSAGGANWTLYGPNNAYLGGNGLGADFEVTVPRNGNCVVVFANSTNPLTYSNQVNTFTYTTNAIALGTIVTNNLVQPGDQFYYTFSGTAGQRIYFDSLSSSYLSISFALVSPTGQQLASGNVSYDYGSLITLPQTGTYVMQVDGSSDTVGSFSFDLIDIDAQSALPLNGDLVGNLAPTASLVYKLAGAAGQQLYFNAKGGTGGGATWSLYAPNNAAINYNNLNADFEQTLPFNGTYALVFAAGANPITYSNQVNTFGYITNIATPGSLVVSSIAHPGDQLYYTFSGAAGQRLFYNARATNYTSVGATLISPLGMTVFNGNAASDSGPFTLTQSGTYTLILDGSGDTLSAVAFNILDLAAATPLTLGTPASDVLSDQTETKLYKFSGTAGQRINLQSLSASGNQALWALFSPADQIVGAEAYINQTIGIVTLPVTGTYTVAVIGNGQVPLPVTYQFSASDVSDAPVSASGFGVVNSGTVNANQTNSYTYTASAGTLVFLDSQDTSGQSLLADLFAPDGSLVFSLNETADSTPYVLPRSGTYTMNMHGYNGASGNYKFRLLNLGASPQLSLNTSVIGTLASSYQTEVFQFSTTPGQKFYYDALTNDVNFPSVFANILDPHGQSIGPAGTDFQTDRGPFVVQYGGTSYLMLRNSTANPSSYSFQLLDVSAQPVLPINTAVTNTLGVYANWVYRYNGKAGQQLYFAGQPSNPSGIWTLYDPNNALVSGSGAGFTTDFEVTLPYTGNYTLVVYSYSTTPGTGSFLVNDYNAFTNSYTLGTTVVDAIQRPGERHFYTFNGTIGQQLIYDALTNDPPVGAISAVLLNPQGIAAPESPIGGRFSFDRGPFTLQQSGTYTLVIDGNGSAVGPFAFRLLDVSVQPVLPVNAAVTNTLSPYPLIVYRYSATAGQQLYFHGDPNNLSGFWALYDQNNSSLGSAGLTADFELTLAKTGTYALVLGNYTTTSGPEIFQVNDFHYLTNSYTIGTPIVDAINRPGEQKYYTFTGSVGQRLIYNALTNDPPYPSTIVAQLINPDGNAEGPIGGRFSNNHGPFTLQESGTYTLVLDGQGAGVGTFAFKLLDVAQLPPLPIGPAITNTLPGFAIEAYQYNGLPGQNLYFRGSGGNPSGGWSLYDPRNGMLFGAGLISDFQVTLALPGTNVLLITSYLSSAATETFQVNGFNQGETVAVNRAPVLTPIPNPKVAANVLVTFTAQASDPDNNALTFSLDPGSPDKATINPTSGAFSWDPPVTGLSSVTPITVRVSDNGTPSLSTAQTIFVEVVAFPAMIAAQPTVGGANVSWHSAPGNHYQLLFKNEIDDPNWQTNGSPVTATSLITTQLDSTIGPRNHRFYRLQFLDPLP